MPTPHKDELSIRQDLSIYSSPTALDYFRRHHPRTKNVPLANIAKALPTALGSISGVSGTGGAALAIVHVAANTRSTPTTAETLANILESSTRGETLSSKPYRDA